jgi:hypothetical protein
MPGLLKGDTMSSGDIASRLDRATAVLTTVACLIPAVVGAILYPQLPAQIAMHWDMQGAASGFADELVAAIVVPVAYSYLEYTGKRGVDSLSLPRGLMAVP